MAIKIPSKNIYEIDNPKIRDNMIDNVNVEQTVIKPNNEYETPIYNEELSNVFSKGSKQYDYQQSIDMLVLEAYIAYVEAIPEYANIPEIKFPILKNNNYISKIYIGKNENNEPNIKFALIGNIFKGEASKKYNLTQGALTEYDTVYKLPTSSKYNVRYELPSTTIEETISSDNGGYTSKAKVTINDLSNILTISYKEENDYYIFNDLKIISGLKFAKLKNSVKHSDPDNWGDFTLYGTYEEYTPTQIEITIYGNTIGIDLTDGSVTYGSGNKPFLLSGNELMQHKETINYANVKGFSHNGAGLTINGNENNMLVVNGTCVVPSGTVGRYHINLGVVSLPKGKYILKGMPKAIGMSALILHNTKVSTIAESFYEPIEFYLEEQQDLTFYFVVSDGSIFNNFIIAPEIININNSEYLANNILNQYANGKETATLLCDISDYYDESGEKVIDIKTNKMSFRLHDEVIPYVYGADGKDKPMSKKQDGSAKVFEVVGSNIIYDGAVWQELTLLEKTQNN